MREVPPGPPDQVPRLERYRQEHPDVDILAPGAQSAVWRAFRGGDLIAYGFTLMVFLERLEALPEPLGIAHDFGVYHPVRRSPCQGVQGRARPAPSASVPSPRHVPVRLIPDQERIESFWLFGLHGNVGHDGELRAAPRPVQQVADVIGWSLEGGLDATVGKVTHPSAHAMLQGHPPAGGAEVDTLDLTGDQHPIADHKQTVRHGSRSGAPAVPARSRDR